MASYASLERSRRMQCNALAPISILPPEILSTIFLHKAGGDYSDFPDGGRRRAIASFSVTHVCTYWRQVALQCAELWSQLQVPDFPDMLDELLSWSRETPLSITLQFAPVNEPEPYSTEDACLLGLSALHRVRRLSLHADAEYDPSSEILERLGSATPLLESLYITNCSRGAALPSAISRMLSTCTLLSLDTTLNSIDWTNTPLHSLTYLYVYRYDFSSETTTHSILKALRCMPCLEELFLEGVWDGTWDVTQILPSPITLLHLRCLRIHYEQHPFTTALLNGLRTPSLRQLEVVGFAADCAPLVAVMSQRAATLGPFLTLPFASYYDSFSAYRDAFEHTLEPTDDSTNKWKGQHTAALGVDGAQEAGHISTLLLPPLRDITTLMLQDGFPVSHQDEWLSLTQGMESVTELRLLYNLYDEDEMVKMLSMRHRDLGDGRATLVLPNLNTVTMDTPTFPRQKHQLGAALATCFAQRALEAAEVKTLRILRAQNFLEKDYERLRQAVPCVETDMVI
ncbi:hypothetical protein C8Q72DRAFT_864961 [Fomitopsis betulina]|nr:hypothetical protein C8Q72DRAFT_864961 [Fomitopsis betulina]